jgi:hypothetical protein
MAVLVSKPKAPPMARLTSGIAPQFAPHKNEQNMFCPECMFCGTKIDLLDEGVVVLKGQWMPNTELGEPVFVLEPDAKLKFVQLANGQYGLLAETDPNETHQVIDHMHDECLERLRLRITEGFEMDDDDMYDPFEEGR